MKDSIPEEYGRPVHPISSYALKPALNFYKKMNKPLISFYTIPPVPEYLTLPMGIRITM